jgi:hypothetical protein
MALERWRAFHVVRSYPNSIPPGLVGRPKEVRGRRWPDVVASYLAHLQLDVLSRLMRSHANAGVVS